MPPERSRQLVDEIRAFYATGTMRQKDLAAALGLSPQSLNEILSGRNNPNSETTLRMLEFLQTMKPQLVDPPAMPRVSTRDPNEPKTLHEAKGMIEALRAQLKGGAVALPVKIVLPPATPGQPRAAASTTRQGIVANRTPEQKLPEKLTLPASATTPFLADEIIKVTPTDSLRRMLDSETISWRKAALYRAIKEREKLSTY
jgi:DNA-binding XRE family transcriptional regulator